MDSLTTIPRHPKCNLRGSSHDKTKPASKNCQQTSASQRIGLWLALLASASSCVTDASFRLDISKVKSIDGTARIAIVLVAVVLFVGWEAFRLSRQRASEKLRLAEARRKTKSSESIIECFGNQPPIIRTRNDPSLMDVTQSWGLDFQQAVGPLGTYFMPESIGTGGALFDADGDGRLDLYLVQSDRSPGAEGDFPSGARSGSRFFRQTEAFTFEDRTQESGLAGAGYGVGCAVGDVDNDGDADLYVTRYEQDGLFLNHGDGTFADVTEASGIRENDWGTCAAFFDYNRDGLLDLIVVNYTADPQYGHSVACGFREGLVSYCGPGKFLPTVDRLYRNDGVQTDSNGVRSVRFSDVTQEAGLGDVKTYGFGVVCADFNADGWPDMFIANDGAANRLWINQHDGTFVEEAVPRGCAANGDGRVEAGMGVAVGDVNQDGLLDILVTHLSDEKATLYVGKENGFFEDVSRMSGIAEPSNRHTGWGTALIDLNHDGELDCPVVNGLVIPCHSGFPPHGEDRFQVRHDVIRDAEAYWRDYADQNILLMGKGNGQFLDATDRGGDFCSAIGSGRGLIYGDLDNDGDIDLVVTNCGGRAKLYRNDYSKVGNWLMVRAVDPRWNRDAIGAEVIVRTSSKTHSGLVNSASSYLTSNDVRVHFGMGSDLEYEQILVKWPDGPVDSAMEVYDGGKTNRLVTLYRGSGRDARGNP